MSAPVNFDELVKEVTHSQVGRATLSVWGGRCFEDNLLEFLREWEKTAQMPYRIWEYASDIVFEENTLPDDPVLLQRGRLFGKDGDLEVRRDGTSFAWRFIGPPKIQPPAGNFDTQNYWN